MSEVWPTRKDSEPRPRKAWAGSAAKRVATFSLLGTSTKLLSLTNRPTKKAPTSGAFLLAYLGYAQLNRPKVTPAYVFRMNVYP